MLDQCIQYALLAAVENNLGVLGSVDLALRMRGFRSLVSANLITR